MLSLAIIKRKWMRTGQRGRCRNVADKREIALNLLKLK
jgi:hypothetical protein